MSRDAIRQGRFRTQKVPDGENMDCKGPEAEMQGSQLQLKQRTEDACGRKGANPDTWGDRAPHPSLRII